MSDEQITPALTAEEWVRFGEFSSLNPQRFVDLTRHSGERHRHGTAALCLYGQPYGFTQEDVVLLAKLDKGNDYAEGDRFGVIDEEITPEESVRLRSLARRIAALLPPSEGA